MGSTATNKAKGDIKENNMKQKDRKAKFLPGMIFSSTSGDMWSKYSSGSEYRAETFDWF